MRSCGRTICRLPPSYSSPVRWRFSAMLIKHFLGVIGELHSHENAGMRTRSFTCSA